MSENLLYSVIDTTGTPTYRQSEITPSSYLVYDESGAIAAKSGLAISDVGDLQNELDSKAPKLSVFSVDAAPYNAAGDGVTDDTAAIQACIADAIAAGGGTVQFSAKTYLINTLTALDGMSQNLSIRGDHPDMVLLFQGNGGRLFTNNTDAGTMLFIKATFREIGIDNLTFERSDDVFGNGPNWLAITARNYDTETEVGLISLSRCRFINAGRTLNFNVTSSVAAGKLKLLRVTNCEFLHPYGSGQSDTGGGADDCILGGWVDVFLFENNIFDGCVGGTIPADSAVTGPKDGFLLGGARKSIITNNVFRNFAFEGLYFEPNTTFGATASTTTVTVPEVGDEVTLAFNFNDPADTLTPGEELYLTSGLSIYFIGSVVSYDATAGTVTVTNLGIDGSTAPGTVLSNPAGVWLNKYADMKMFSAVITNNIFDGSKGGKGATVWGANPAIWVRIPCTARISDNTFIGCKSDICVNAIVEKAIQPTIISGNRFIRPDVVADYQASSTMGSVTLFPSANNTIVSRNTFVFHNNAYQGGVETWGEHCEISDNTFTTENPTLETGNAQCFALNVSVNGQGPDKNYSRNTIIRDNTVNGLSGVMLPNDIHEMISGTTGMLADGTPSYITWNGFITLADDTKPFKPNENGWWTVARTTGHFGSGLLLANVQICGTDTLVDFQGSSLNYAGPWALPITLNMANQRGPTAAISAVRIIGGNETALQVKVADYTKYSNDYSLARLRSLTPATNLSFLPSKKITNIAAGNPAVLTLANHGLSTGDTVYISDSDCTPQISEGYAVTVIDANTFSVPVAVSTAGTTAEMFVGAFGYGVTLAADSTGVKSSEGFGVVQSTTVAGAVVEFPGQLFRNTVDGRWALGPGRGGLFEYIQPYDDVLAGIPNRGGIPGTNTADDAATGYVGEVISNVVPYSGGISLSTGIPSNVMVITLSPGDWDVTGHVTFAGTTATIAELSAGISLTSGTLPTDGNEAVSRWQSSTTTFRQTLSLSTVRVSLANYTNICLVGACTFSAGTVSQYGAIMARRAR